MTFDEQVVREQICDVCHKMWQLGWVAANDGISTYSIRYLFTN